MSASIKPGSFGLLLPIFVTVAHRMFPLFAGNVVAGYTVWRAMGSLAAFRMLALAHLTLELVHACAWLWLPDRALMALFGFWLWRTWPRASAPALPRVLFFGYGCCPWRSRCMQVKASGLRSMASSFLAAGGLALGMDLPDSTGGWQPGLSCPKTACGVTQVKAKHDNRE